MKRIPICVLCILFVGWLPACGRAAQPADTTSAISAPSETLEAGVYDMPANLADLTADEMPDEADVSCVPLERDGRVIGFEMRFLQSAKLDALFSDEANMYFAVADCGKKPIGIPMEQIRILTDSTTREFVLTLLLESGEKLSGKTCAVSFYTAKRGNVSGNALFCARKEISLR